MDQRRFDDLTRALADGTSRRQALKLLGGSLLAALVPGAALAKGGGNSACAQFCASVFGGDTPAAKQCTTDAAHQKGLCYDCGPASNNQGAQCGTVCCSSSQVCQSGSCCLPSGAFLNPISDNRCSADRCCSGSCQFSDAGYVCQ